MTINSVKNTFNKYKDVISEKSLTFKRIYFITFLIFFLKSFEKRLI